MVELSAPSIDKTAFSCPYCMAYSSHIWYAIQGIRLSDQYGKPATPNNHKTKSSNPLNIVGVWSSICSHCGRQALWYGDKMLFPENIIGYAPSPDLPLELRGDYEEARMVFSKSPRAAAALLRLCIQKLCGILGETTENINQAIKGLVAKGLPNGVQEALDIVRVIGNNAVHPGEMNLNDDTKTVESLFGLVNFIVNKMITEPKQLQALYGSLPEGALKQIEQRDRKTS